MPRKSDQISNTFRGSFVVTLHPHANSKLPAITQTEGKTEKWQFCRPVDVGYQRKIGCSRWSLGHCRHQNQPNATSCWDYQPLFERNPIAAAWIWKIFAFAVENYRSRDMEAKMLSVARGFPYCKRGVTWLGSAVPKWKKYVQRHWILEIWKPMRPSKAVELC